MAKKHIGFISLALLLAVVVLISFGCKSKVHPSETLNVMGTTVTITVFDPGMTAADMKPVFGEIAGLMADWERKTLLPGSLNQITGISKGAGTQSVPVEQPIFDMLMKALRFYDASGNVFDVRYGPMLQKWGFGQKPRVPAKAELDSLRPFVADGGMFVAGNSILLAKQGMSFDVREIALGQVMDLAAVKLADRGIRSAMIASPRVCRTMGDPPDSKGFPYFIADPVNLEKKWAKVFVPVGGTAYASVGVDRFESGGKSYHSLLDARTGLPAERCAGAVVQSKDAATAQAMAYSVFVWGTPDSLAAEGKTEIAGCIIVKSNGSTLDANATGSLAGKLEVSK